MSWPKDFHFSIHAEEKGFTCHRICKTGSKTIWGKDKHNTLFFCHHEDLGAHQIVVKSGPDHTMRCVQVRDSYFTGVSEVRSTRLRLFLRSNSKLTHVALLLCPLHRSDRLNLSIMLQVFLVPRHFDYFHNFRFNAQNPSGIYVDQLVFLAIISIL